MGNKRFDYLYIILVALYAGIVAFMFGITWVPVILKIGDKAVDDMIREMKKEDYCLLDNLLYEAIISNSLLKLKEQETRIFSSGRDVNIFRITKR